MVFRYTQRHPWPSAERTKDVVSEPSSPRNTIASGHAIERRRRVETGDERTTVFPEIRQTTVRQEIGNVYGTEASQTVIMEKTPLPQRARVERPCRRRRHSKILVEVQCNEVVSKR